MTKKKRGRQKGGNPAIIPILTAVNEVAKIFKPATKLKGTRLGKVPVIGSILEGLSKLGYGEKGSKKQIGPFVTAVEADVSQFKKRRLPIYPNQGLNSVITSHGNGKKKGYGVNLFAY